MKPVSKDLPQLKSRPKSTPAVLSPFSKKVMSLIKSIPRGKVATYGQIAKLAGKPHGARGVGWLLNSCSKKYKLPWQRVIGSSGRISFSTDTQEFFIQKRRLQIEGVQFVSEAGIDMENHHWKHSK